MKLKTLAVAASFFALSAVAACGGNKPAPAAGPEAAPAAEAAPVAEEAPAAAEEAAPAADAASDAA